MAKRPTGVGSKKKSHPHKTKKRLEAKHQMLLEKVGKNRRHNRPVRSLA
jgi:hypothetical protein